MPRNAKNSFFAAENRGP